MGQTVGAAVERMQGWDLQEVSRDIFLNGYQREHKRKDGLALKALDVGDLGLISCSVIRFPGDCELGTWPLMSLKMDMKELPDLIK